MPLVSAQFTCNSSHHCVGFLFFAWIPPLSAGFRRLTITSHLSSHLSHHTTTHHSSTSHTSHPITSNHIQLITQHSALSWCALGRRWAAAAFRVAGAVHRGFWRRWCARGRRWAAADFHVARAVHRAFWRSCCTRGRRWAAAGPRCGLCAR